VPADTWFGPGPGRRLVVHVYTDDRVEFSLIEPWWR